MSMELRERASCAAQVFVYDLNNVNVDPDDRHHLARVLPVSYTHLTLPTICSV